MNLDSASGMVGVYSPHSSSLTLAGYHVILGMNRADKWTALPNYDSSNTGGNSSNNSSSSTGGSSGGGADRPGGTANQTPGADAVEIKDEDTPMNVRPAFTDVALDAYYANAVA